MIAGSMSWAAARRRRAARGGGALGAAALGLGLAVGGVVPAAAAAAGNGIASMPPAKALAAAAAALKTQPRLVMTGTISQSGGSLRILAESTGKGAEYAGSIVVKVPSAHLAFTLQLVVLPSAYYINGGKGFWSAAFTAAGTSVPKAEEAKLVTALAGKWIELTAAQGKSLTGDLGVFRPASLAGEAAKAAGTLTDGTVKEIGGTPALPITSSSGDTVWLATTGQPLPLEVTGKIPGLNASTGSPTGSSGGLGGLGSLNGATGGASGGSGAATGTISFAYPAKLAITAPKGAKTFDEVLAGGA